MSKRRILSLNHSATRNGASILLLEFIRWMQRQSDFDIEVLSLGHGSLLRDFRSAVPTMHLSRPVVQILESSNHAASIARHLFSEAFRIRRHDLVYANTAATWHLANTAKQRHIPVVWHIHEFRYGLQSLLGAKTARSRLQRASRFIVVSKAVHRVLTEELGIPQEHVEIIHGFLRATDLAPEARRLKRAEILSAFDWPPNTFLVGACGSLGRRKGSDLFRASQGFGTAFLAPRDASALPARKQRVSPTPCSGRCASSVRLSPSCPD